MEDENEFITVKDAGYTIEIGPIFETFPNSEDVYMAEVTIAGEEYKDKIKGFGRTQAEACVNALNKIE